MQVSSSELQRSLFLFDNSGSKQQLPSSELERWCSEVKRSPF
ncbi:hypothetical protein [Nostoc sp. 106C]|nr:hypothetical protein [Nostoc sp. 106C]